MSGTTGRHSEGTGYPERKFSRSAWDRIEHRKRDQATVTMWIGFASVVVAVTIADIDPDDLDISVLETSLMLRGTVQSNFSQDIDLPCAVDLNPIRIPDSKGILYILLLKKKETAR
ncbi:MAG: Hsp20/alpha crystallin family protein [Deltaproteobacteria bacterium]